MPFLIRPARHSDCNYMHELATSLSAQGFLTLPSREKDLELLIGLSERSFGGKITKPEEGNYLFVLEDLKARKVIGSSLVIACHGRPESPHLFFQVDEDKRTLNFQAEDAGRTELGGLILDPAYRRHKYKLGKALSLIRFLYIKRNQPKFCPQLLAELLPPFTPEGKSLFWESLGRRLTGMDYRDADAKARRDKKFVMNLFPRGPVSFNVLSPEAQKVIGVAGPETQPVVNILTALGFHYLHQIDPFDGGPHYGAAMSEIRFEVVEEFFLNQEEEREIRWMFTPL